MVSYNIPNPENTELLAAEREWGSGNLVLSERREVRKQKS